MIGKGSLSKASVVWITGLSGAGKTTLAKQLATVIRNQGEPCIVVDGDEVRELFGEADDGDRNHGRSTRLKYAYGYGKLARLIAGQGVTVVVSTISLVKEVHVWNRANLPRYIEVYLKVPLEELRRRDPKGIYRRFDAGELVNVWGLDLPIDEPEAAEIVVAFDQHVTTEATVDLIVELMRKKAS